MTRREPAQESKPSPALIPASANTKTAITDEPPIAFPAGGHISHSAFGAIARANLPSPQRDHGLVGDEFRAFLRQSEIAFDTKNIPQLFANFCAHQRKSEEHTYK